MGKILGKELVKILEFPSPTVFLYNLFFYRIGVYSRNSSKMFNYCLLVLNFNQLFLIVNQFICHYTRHDIYVTTVTFHMTLLMNRKRNIVLDDGRVHPLAKTMPFSSHHLVMEYCS